MAHSTGERRSPARALILASCPSSPPPRSSPRPTSAGQGPTFAPNETLVVSYYDRSCGSDNSTGYFDITVSASRDRGSFAHKLATSSAVPPPAPPAGQWCHGDYAVVDAPLAGGGRWVSSLDLGLGGVSGLDSRCRRCLLGGGCR